MSFKHKFSYEEKVKIVSECIDGTYGFREICKRYNLSQGSLKERKEEKRLSVQKTIRYKEMGKNGICRVQGNTYLKCIRFYDINYRLAQNEDKNSIFENWCDFLNYFDSSIHFQLSFINHKSTDVYSHIIDDDRRR